MRSRRIAGAWVVMGLTLTGACPRPIVRRAAEPPVTENPQAPPVGGTALTRVLQSALAQTRITHSYDPDYEAIPYPNGDVAPEKGVCSDVVIRAFRKGGVDLQRLVHEDMAAHFAAYPHLWGLRRPDPNIDHRRVANLMCFFARHGARQPLSPSPVAYQPGDVVAWRLPNGRLHMGLVSDTLSPGTGRRLIVHNIGVGTQLEDVLFAWPVIGHYRYFQAKGG